MVGVVVKLAMRQVMRVIIRRVVMMVVTVVMRGVVVVKQQAMPASRGRVEMPSQGLYLISGHVLNCYSSREVCG